VPGDRVGTAGIGVRAALDDVAGLGPFFAASANPAEAVDPTWRPCRELYDDPSVLAARIDVVAGVLGTDDRRVAASIAFQGLAARLVSPVVATAAVHGLVPAWTPESLHWRPAVSGPWPLWESEPGTVRRIEPADVAQGGDLLADALTEPHLAALVTATRAVASVSPRVLWGNAASALAAAGRLVAQSHPRVARRAGDLVAAVLRSGPLAGAGGFESGWSFRRRSCCLYYRIPGGGICGDCVLGTG
jgi:ferric iron reductase protein FhuF